MEWIVQHMMGHINANLISSGLTTGTGFINEMRIVAMKLHTRDQAPKEGQQEAPKQPMVSGSLMEGT